MKRKLIKIFKIVLSILALLYVALCTWFYFNQESFLFFPQKLDQNHKFSINDNFEEIEINTVDSITLNAILFKVDNPSGLIFYLHGNGGSLDNWGQYAGEFNEFNYDVFMLDYRGYGKSEGEITNETQFYKDVQVAYDYIRKDYDENNIIVFGISLGTGPASWLASNNNPNQVILLAPYYSIPDMKNNFEPLPILKIVPSFLLKYKFKNYENIEKLKAPLTIFHGTGDKVIYYGSSLKLKNHLKPGDTLITIEGGPHHIHHENEQVHNSIAKILSGN